MAIVTISGAALKAAPGDGLALQVVFTMSDGTTQALPASTTVSWTAPTTLTAQDPYDAGDGVLPDSGTQPNAFYVANSFRPEHPGVLFVTSAGALDSLGDAGDAGIPDATTNITVTATLPDASLSAQVAISPTPVGDATRGQNLFQSVLQCAGCHGTTGGGSPPSTLADGGIETDPDGAVLYDLQGTKYPFPAPGLNNAPGSGNVANDPDWSAGLLGMAAQSDIDNLGVALRAPMPVWLGKQGAGTAALNAQDFADIYAWLKTQTQ
jgi:mono/diheme cytochrome c family protein